MVQAMLLAQLLGDYVLQTEAMVRWKYRSVWGVAFHASVVTLCLWLCSLPFTPDWWPYALGIGITHALIDFVRTRLDKMGPAATLFLYLGDQAAHALTVVAALYGSGWLRARPAETALGAWLQTGWRLNYIAGYVLLSVPGWVLVHFVARGMGIKVTNLPGRAVEKYAGMIERGLIATCVLLGQYLFVPLVVAPRLVLDRNGRVGMERSNYLGELLISAGLAVAVGVFLKGLS